MQILVVMSQLLLKGHKMLNFLFTFFKISETLKAHISGTEADKNGEKLPSWSLTVFHISQ